jgi:hypothetical protein
VGLSLYPFLRRDCPKAGFNKETTLSPPPRLMASLGHPEHHARGLFLGDCHRTGVLHFKYCPCAIIPHSCQDHAHGIRSGVAHGRTEQNVHR